MSCLEMVTINNLVCKECGKSAAKKKAEDIQDYNKQEVKQKAEDPQGYTENANNKVDCKKE